MFFFQSSVMLLAQNLVIEQWTASRVDLILAKGSTLSGSFLPELYAAYYAKLIIFIR